MAPSFLFCIPNLVSHRPICAEILYSTVPKQCRSRHFLIFFPILGIVQNSSYILSLRPGQGLILVYTLKCTPSTSFYLSQPKGTKILVVALGLTGNVACQFCPWQQPGATYSILQYYTRNNVSVDCQCCSRRASSLIHVRWIVNWQFHALFAWLISHQPAVVFSQNKPAINNQPTVLFSQNKPAPAISHQPNEQGVY
jgi:hypothetical protein